MSDFLASLKADLISRRLAPLLILATVGLACAIFYALHVSGQSIPKAPVAAATPAESSSLTVTHASNAADQAVAETANGASYQHRGHAHDPFTPLASTSSTTTTTSTTPASSTSPSTTPAASSNTSSSTTDGVSGTERHATTGGDEPASPTGGRGQATTGGGGESTTTTPTTGSQPKTPSKTEKRKTVYRVTVEFGAAPAAGGPPQLTTYPELKRGQEFPAAPATPIVVFAGVLDDGSYAIFKLVGEVVPSIAAACLPSEVKCETLKLAAGRSEQFEVHTAEGQTIVYTLQVMKIVKTSVPAAAG